MKAYGSIWFNGHQIIENHYYTVAQLADWFNTSKKIIYQHIHDKHFRCGQITQEFLIEGGSIIQHLNRFPAGKTKKSKVLPSFPNLESPNDEIEIINCDSKMYIKIDGEV